MSTTDLPAAVNDESVTRKLVTDAMREDGLLPQWTRTETPPLETPPRNKVALHLPLNGRRAEVEIYEPWPGQVAWRFSAANYRTPYSVVTEDQQQSAIAWLLPILRKSVAELTRLQVAALKTEMPQPASEAEEIIEDIADALTTLRGAITMLPAELVTPAERNMLLEDHKRIEDQIEIVCGRL